MVNQDVFGAGFKVAPANQPGDGENIGHYRTVTLTSADGDQSSHVTLSNPITDPQQGIFCFGFRLTPETGNLLASQMTFAIDTMGVRVNCFLIIEDISLNGFSASRIKASPTVNLGTQIEIISATDGYTLLYSDINTSSKHIQPGVVHWITGNIVKNDLANSHISINGRKLLNGTNCTEVLGGYGWGPSDGDNKILVSHKVFGAIPIKIDLFNVYGAILATPTGTDGTEFMEPLVNYNDWGTPTMEDGRIYYTSIPDMWQLNWNSTTDPLGNVGINEGVFTGSTMSYSLVEEEMFLHPNVGEGKYRCVKIEDEQTTTDRYYMIQFDTDLIDYSKQHYIVCITELNGATDNRYHPFCGFTICNSASSSSSSSSKNDLVGFSNFGDGASDKANTRQGGSRYSEQSLSPSFATPFKNKLLQTAWTGYSYLKHYVANKANKSIGSRNNTTFTDTWGGAKLNVSIASTSTKYDRRIIYQAIYSADLIALHPEIDWANGVAMHEYFYKPGTYTITDDLVNAIPGIQPTIVLYNARQVRGLSYERHSLPTFQKKQKSYHAHGSSDGIYSATDFYSTDMIVEGDFEVPA